MSVLETEIHAALEPEETVSSSVLRLDQPASIPETGVFAYHGRSLTDDQDQAIVRHLDAWLESFSGPENGGCGRSMRWIGRGSGATYAASHAACLRS
jgi:hypothetical protein